MTSDDDNKDVTPPLPPPPSFGTFYIAPMGDLISRLKIVSITSCALSVGVLPALVALKHGALPTTQQMSLGGLALLGAVGSTVALQFVFGPYVLHMERMEKEDEKSTDEGNGKCVEDNQDVQTQISSQYLLKATTRSVFGWKTSYTFDPSKDIIEPYHGVRPFANFSVNKVPLYVHPELVDSITRQLLLLRSINDECISNSTQESQQQQREEGIPKTNKKSNSNDDDFF